MTWRTTSLEEMLTPEQILHARSIYVAARDLLEKEVIAPNLPAINRRLGQENDARFLTYAVLWVMGLPFEKAVDDARQ